MSSKIDGLLAIDAYANCVCMFRINEHGLASIVIVEQEVIIEQEVCWSKCSIKMGGNHTFGRAVEIL